MGALADPRFWAGVLVALVAYWAWNRYRAKAAE